MRYPALIGRRFLYKFDYLVDVKQKNINDKIINYNTNYYYYNNINKNIKNNNNNKNE